MSQPKIAQSLDYQRSPIKLLNKGWRLANKLGLGKISLDADELIAAARKETGLQDFGDESIFEPMAVLLQSLEQESDLNPLGRFMNRANIVRLLKHRLYVHDLLKKHPEILERKMPDPVVVVGLARSGTTRLHRLLASDSRFLHLKTWETVNPVPTPESFESREKGTLDPRISMIDQALKAILYLNPQVADVHPLGTYEVEEEVGLIQHGFSSQVFELQSKVPSFGEWLMTHDQTAAYEYMKVLLKIISWYRNDPEDKPWALKTPQHMQDLDALINVFPNAKLICSHRDPLKTVGSACSMTWSAIVRDSDSICADWVGQEWFNKTRRMLEKTLRVREEMVPKENQTDVQYADISKNWQASMQGIYDFLGYPLTDETKTAMQDWLERSKQQHKHGAHKYSLADFGLDTEEVDQALMFYREKFNIPYETRNPNADISVTSAKEKEKTATKEAIL